MKDGIEVEKLAGQIACSIRDLDSSRFLHHSTERSAEIRRLVKQGLENLDPGRRETYLCELLDKIGSGELAEPTATVSAARSTGSENLSPEELLAQVSRGIRAGTISADLLRHAGLELLTENANRPTNPNQNTVLPGAPAVIGLPEDVQVDSLRLCKMAAMLARTMDDVFDVMWRSWWKLAPVPLAAEAKETLEPLRFHQRLKAAFRAKTEIGFDAELDSAIEPIVMVKALLVAAADAAEPFSERHKSRFLSREIMSAAALKGITDKAGLWQYFWEKTKRDDHQSLVDFFRKAVMQSVWTNHDSERYLSSFVRENFPDANPWPGKPGE